jgi:putative transposase
LITKQPTIPRAVICSSLGMSRSASYYHHKLPHKDSPWLDKIVKVLISNPDYGIYRLKLHFNLAGECISQVKIRRICRSNGITSKPKKKNPPSRDRNEPYAGIPNLIKNIESVKPDQIWCGDFSYFKVGGVWMYMATVIDTYTKEILGFSLSTHHTASLVCDSLTMALKKQRKPIIFHSDQGSEYNSVNFRDLLDRYSINQSNSEKSSPWQNGYQESFYGKFKQEMGLYRIQACKTFMEAYNLLTQRIEYYNTRRIHTSIRNIPVQFYNNWQFKEENLVSEKVGG